MNLCISPKATVQIRNSKASAGTGSTVISRSDPVVELGSSSSSSSSRSEK
jgi:hypothetical protein